MSPKQLDERHSTVLVQFKVPADLHVLMQGQAAAEGYTNTSEWARRLFRLATTASPNMMLEYLRSARRARLEAAPRNGARTRPAPGRRRTAGEHRR